jgi:hypothetical protein
MVSYLYEKRTQICSLLFCIQKERCSALLPTLRQRSYEEYVVVRKCQHEREHDTRITSYSKTYRISHVLYNKNHSTVEFIEEIG